jgi:hypothetical protein
VQSISPVIGIIDIPMPTDLNKLGILLQVVDKDMEEGFLADNEFGVRTDGCGSQDIGDALN